MSINWRKYLSPCFLKFENQLRLLNFNKFIDFLKHEKVIICHDKYKLAIRFNYADKSSLNFNLYYINTKDEKPVLVLYGMLKSLENEGQEFSRGDYHQCNINRNTREILPKISFGRVFHAIIRINRNELDFIKKIYSTPISESLSYSGCIFWKKQAENKFAIWVEGNNRFMAILE